MTKQGGVPRLLSHRRYHGSCCRPRIIQVFEKAPLLFCDFLRPKVDDDGPSTYEEAKELPKLVTLLSDALEDYNVTNPTQMNLVFFRDAVEHVCRISRILRQVGLGLHLGCLVGAIVTNACALCRLFGGSLAVTRCWSASAAPASSP